MLNLSNCISIIGINVLQILKNIEKLSLFKAIDIATIFSIPLELVNEGIIKYLGFSFHGSPEILEMLLKLKCWDLVQL